MFGPAADDELRALMVRYQAGDAAAFNELYARLAPPLRRYLLALARDGQRADDLLQDTFLQIHRSRRTYNPGRPVRPWAFAVARHAWLMDRRTRRRKAPPHLDLDAAPELPAPSAVDAIGLGDCSITSGDSLSRRSAKCLVSGPARRACAPAGPWQRFEGW